MLDLKKTVLGIEFGSTRIKAVLIDETHEPIAGGSYEWQDKLENGVWTYSQELILHGLQECYKDLKNDVASKYGTNMTTLGAIGISAMMHGYLPFDDKMNLLTPFRTWRNTITGEAAEKLTEAFGFNIPQRWSIAHLYQAVLNKEEHVPQIDFITTLAGYVHYLLTGEKVIGIGDASGMVPIDSTINDFDASMIKTFNELNVDYNQYWQLQNILPRVLVAGDNAGYLTAEGAALLDPSGELQPGVPLCPPEGDAGTGMAATNSVKVKTGNVSAGTSVFSMIVLEKALEHLHTEIDMVTTPSGAPVAMVHCNTCTSDLNAWVRLFKDFAALTGAKIEDIYALLFNEAMKGDKTGGGLVAFNYFSGEPVIGTDEGCPMLLRKPDAPLSLANFMRVQLYATLSALKYGMDILVKEGVEWNAIVGHGGLFKTPVVGQTMLSAALNAPVTVMETAGEGGAWGIALLAGYSIWKLKDEQLDSYLAEKVFGQMKSSTLMASDEDVSGFDAYMKKYTACIPAEKTAASCMR